MMHGRNVVHHQQNGYRINFLHDLQATRYHERNEPAPEVSLAAHPHKPTGNSSVSEAELKAMDAYLFSNPVWSSLRIMYRIVGSQIAMLDSTVTQYEPIALAHLYNALLVLRHVDSQEGRTILKQGWEDLETFTKLVRVQKFFLASTRPTTLKDCSNRVLLAMGAKASDFAADKRTTNAKPNPQPRGFKADMSVLRALMENYTTKRDPTGQSRIGIYSSSIFKAMALFAVLMRGVKAQCKMSRLGWESRLFRIFSSSSVVPSNSNSVIASSTTKT